MLMLCHVMYYISIGLLTLSWMESEGIETSIYKKLVIVGIWPVWAVLILFCALIILFYAIFYEE